MPRHGEKTGEASLSPPVLAAFAPVLYSWVLVRLALLPYDLSAKPMLGSRNRLPK